MSHETPGNGHWSPMSAADYCSQACDRCRLRARPAASCAPRVRGWRGRCRAWPGLILPIIGERRHGAQQISAYVHKYTLVATTAIHAHNKRSQIYYLKDRTNNGLDITMIRLYVKTTNLDNFSCFVYTGNSFKSVEWCFNCVPYSTVRGLLNEGQLN